MTTTKPNPPAIPAPSREGHPPAASDPNPIAQLEIVLASWRNRIAGLIGAIAGLVPYGAYRLGHYEIASWDPRESPKVLVVIAALAFSILTVSDWSYQVFATRNRVVSIVKSLGFTALVEALMMTSDYRPLSLACLCLLVAINALANGCRLAVRAASHRASAAERAAVRPSVRAAPSWPKGVGTATKTAAEPSQRPGTEAVGTRRPRKRPVRDTAPTPPCTGIDAPGLVDVASADRASAAIDLSA